MLDTYEQMIQAINSYEADIAVCGDFFVDENGENLAIQNVKELSDMEVFNSQKALEILCKDKYIVSHAWDKVYRRNVIINERFPTNHNYEDIYVMHKIFLNAKKIVHINQPKYFYVQRKGSIVKTPSIENQKDLLNAYKTRYDELDKIVNNDIKWAQLNILIEVLTVCSQIYFIKNFENIVKFINFNLKQLSLLGYSLSKKRKLKYFFAKSNLNYVIKPTKLKKYLQKRAFNNVIIDYKERKNYKKNNTQNDYNADIFLIGVPEYGNLGDQLIAEAEFKFLNDIFEKKTICQIKENEIRYDFKKVKKNIKDNGIIILQGGGNLGDLWPDQEIIRKKIITYFKNNPIVIMPQSVSIRNPESLNKIKQIYSKENVWLTVRENKSKKILEDLKLINNVLLVPDIALYLPHFCHVSVPRDDGTDEIKLMSKHSFDEFYNIWKTFDSPMFEFKMRHWGENRKEFCYAGAWSGMLNIATGSLISCSCQKGTYQNIFNHTNKKINFCPVGKCKVSHCFNGHSFLTFGTIPSLDEEHYVDIRDW